MAQAPSNTESQALTTVQATVRSAGADDEETVSARARARSRKRRISVFIARVVTFIVVVGGWQLLTERKILDPFFFGQPSGIVTKLIDWFQNGTEFGSIWLQIGVTMEEAIFGFLFGVLGGIIVGVLLGQNRFLSDVAGPYIKVLNAIPRIVLGSIFLIALGLGTPSKVLLASVLVFFVVFFNAFQGVREVDLNFIANARVLGASPLQIVRHVTIPSALTWIIASLHVAFGFAVIGAIVGEFLGAQKGLGLLIASSQNNLEANGIFAAMLIIAVIALAAEALITALERRLMSWRPPSPTEAGGI